jgi:hypothetical protein
MSRTPASRLVNKRSNQGSYELFLVTSTSKTYVARFRHLRQAIERGFRLIDRQKNSRLKIRQPIEKIENECRDGEWIIGWFMPTGFSKITEVCVAHRIDRDGPRPGQDDQPMSLQPLRTFALDADHEVFRIMISRLHRAHYIGTIANSYARPSWKQLGKIDCDLIQFMAGSERAVLEQCLEWVTINATTGLRLELSVAP